ncbi:MAG: HEPN domain-containing protein [Sodaliphilus pleomorphus]|uniref:HEPN domain-containing protein n=1 Tax=Sodaliphilus pleomorphus TaxID=2606626 RepID=UPI002A74E698|nr:HEPN domain-containing protein [Sodaliphilus pleomorphus]MDY2831435.1 HEPN domain-containing protein [Sodaliphilus pleomorphus]
MNILILHNSNLPVGITSEGTWQIEAEFFNIDYYILSLPPTDRPDFDSFISNELNKINLLGENSGNTLPLAQYDLIVMPLNFTESYMEYTGLRVAAHIRLTKEWKSFSTPILFLGSDNRDEIMRFSPLGELLNTFNIYYSKHNSVGQLCKMFLWINQNKLFADVNSPEYRSFLYRLKLIPAPANYATHHSIANEWAIMRWIDMMTWDDKYPKPEIMHKEFADMLYFKYLMAVAGDRESFSRKYKRNNPLCPKIDGIANNRIVCVDDESLKGWKVLLESIINASGAEIDFYPFDESTKSISKEKLIDDIKDFLLSDYRKNGGADCYVIDLRLHDDDLSEDVKYHELSGHIIAEFIKSKKLNPYNQVVIFTASNKVWNYEKAVKQTKACGYVIKESPEQNLSKTDSKNLFSKFSKDIKHACHLGFLRGLYSSLKQLETDYGYPEDELSLLYQFIELLNIDNNQKQKSLIRASTLTLYAFFESFMDSRFDIRSTDLIRKDRDFCIKWLGRFYVKCEKNDKNENILTDIKTVNDNSVSKDLIGWNKWTLDPNKRDIPKKMLILIPLSLYFNVSDAGLRIVLKLIDRRNSMAHEGKGEYSIEELKEIFNHIILPILRQEASGSK